MEDVFFVFVKGVITRSMVDIFFRVVFPILKGS